jgi:predicted phage tail protein
MQQVRLVGNISKFGEIWNVNCNNIRDVFKLIDCQTPGFREHLIEASKAGISYEIKRGKDFLEYPEELLLSLNDEDIIITEVPVGAKSAGAKILAAILIVTAVVVSAGGFSAIAAEGFKFSALQNVGLAVATNLALTGVSQLLAPGPETDQKQAEGYLFNGPQNNIQQGLPVPVCYGELRVGGAPISTSFKRDNSSSGFTGVGKVIDYGAGATYIPGWNSFRWATPIEPVPEEDKFTV